MARARRDRSHLAYAIAFLGAGNGLLLGRGLELCFGVNRYLLIMLFGALAGAGVALSLWLGRLLYAGNPRQGTLWRAIAAGAGPLIAVFAVYFLWRVLPLLREELAYYQ